jgi:hypothetical protein
MTIYFVTARELNRVKIGWSDNPARRFSKMQSDSPVALTFERQMDGGVQEEFELHGRFTEHRLAGEWFSLSPAIEAFMAQLEAAPVLDVKGRPLSWAPTVIGELRKELSLSLEEFAQRIGMKSKGQVSIIERTGQCSLRVAVAIEELSGGRIDAAALSDDVKIARHGLGHTPEGAQDHV